MKEDWKDINGYEGLYQISNLGKVKSLKNNKILKENLNEYKQVKLYKNGDEKIIKIWSSIWDLEHNTSFNKWTIRQCCKNKCKTVYGYQWEYLI